MFVNTIIYVLIISIVQVSTRNQKKLFEEGRQLERVGEKKSKIDGKCTDRFLSVNQICRIKIQYRCLVHSCPNHILLRYSKR